MKCLKLCPLAASVRSKWLLFSPRSASLPHQHGSPFELVPQFPTARAGAHSLALQSRLALQAPLPETLRLSATGVEALHTLSSSAPSKLEPRKTIPNRRDSDGDVDENCDVGMCCEEMNDDTYLFEANDGWDEYAVCAREVRVGSLTKCLSFWQEIGASKFIQTIIMHGYALPLQTVPGKREFANHRSAHEHCGFVSDAVDNLLEQGCIKEVERGSIGVSSPLALWIMARNCG